MPFRLLAEDADDALGVLLDAVAESFAPSERFRATVTSDNEAVYLFDVNRAKGRRLAARLDAHLGVHGDVTYLSNSPDADGMYGWMEQRR